MQIKSDRTMKKNKGSYEREQQRQGGSNFVAGGDGSREASLRAEDE